MGRPMHVGGSEVCMDGRPTYSSQKFEQPNNRFTYIHTDVPGTGSVCPQQQQPRRRIVQAMSCARRIV